MSNELYYFLHRNNVDNIQDFIKKSNFKIDNLQTNISNNEINNSIFLESTEQIIPLSQIIGMNGSNLKIDNLYFNNFSNFFNSKMDDQYHRRGINMLDYSVEDIMINLSVSFDEEPIETISVDGKYYITTNGLHRFMVLKLYYMLELYKGKTPEELDKKYAIKVNNKELDIFKSFTHYFGSKFNPSIKYRDDLTENQWLIEVKERLSSFNNNDYQLFISTFAFSSFINDVSGEIMIKYLYEYFPTIAIDIFKYLVMNGNYECTTNIMHCVKKYYPNYEIELVQIINNKFNEVLQNDDTSISFKNDWKCFDLEQNWNYYGTPKDITNKSRNLEQFSEGSEALKKCLSVIWSQGIETIACCKGNHLSINVDNNPEIECEAYISFRENLDWQKYLSPEIIKNNNVIINQDSIYYYGRDSETFFKFLCKDFLTGVKDNDRFLNEKDNNVTDELEYSSFINALKEVGFDEEQISFLSEDYLEIVNCQNKFYQSNDIDREIIRKKWREARERYLLDISFYIDRNNQIYSNQIK